MKDYRLTLNEYADYLTELKGSIFKILPLYEEKNEYLNDYIEDVVDEVIYVKVIINKLPHAYWYVKSLSNLESLVVKVKEDNHTHVKKKVLNTINLIQKEINEIER